MPNAVYYSVRCGFKVLRKSTFLVLVCCRLHSVIITGAGQRGGIDFFSIRLLSDFASIFSKNKMFLAAESAAFQHRYDCNVCVSHSTDRSYRGDEGAACFWHCWGSGSFAVGECGFLYDGYCVGSA